MFLEVFHKALRLENNKYFLSGKSPAISLTDREAACFVAY